jgi:acyl carrier protein
MTEQDIYDKLNDIFQQVFDDDEIIVKSETVADDIEEWDSLMHITLVVSIEKEFSFKWQASEIEKLSNVGEMVSLILEKTNS